MKKIGLIAVSTLLFVIAVSYFLFGDGQAQNQKHTARYTRRFLQPGDPMPSISLPDPRGKMRSLDSLRGQYVLVDFWASWCRPCREQNPALVRLYEDFHRASFKTGKGFAIFSISLDGLKTADGKPEQINPELEWAQAIKADKLHWPDHVSERKGWDAYWAQKLGVRQLPYNFLVSPRGLILGIELSLPQLRKTLGAARSKG